MTITPSINIVGCVLASDADPMAIEDCVEWARRFGCQARTEPNSGGMLRVVVDLSQLPP